MDRKISAHYLYPGTGKVLKSGIIFLDDRNTLLRIVDTGGNITESERLEFFSGMIVPAPQDGYIPNSILKLYSLQPVEISMPPHRHFIAELKLIQKTLHIPTIELFQQHLLRKLIPGEPIKIMLITNLDYPSFSFRTNSSAEIIV